MSRIILLRHAKVNIDNPMICSRDMKKFIEAYDHAPIEPFIVEDEIKAIMADADIVLSSDMCRTKETLTYLGTKVQKCDTVFNEAQLPYADGKIIKLPASWWAAIFRLMWLFGYDRESESYQEAKVQARLSADMLIKYAQNHQTVLLVGHGVMNHLITKVLLQRGVLLVKKTDHSNLAYSILKVDKERKKDYTSIINSKKESKMKQTSFTTHFNTRKFALLLSFNLLSL